MVTEKHGNTILANCEAIIALFLMYSIGSRTVCWLKFISFNTCTAIRFFTNELYHVILVHAILPLGIIKCLEGLEQVVLDL